MRIHFVWLVLVATACTRHNPASCCATQQQCDSFGLKSITGCQSGQVCDSTGTCEMAQCTTSADCTSSDAPVCIDQLCVAKCMTNMDCNGLAGRPYCAADGACVACTDSSQCTADAPVCDAMTSSCRACTLDSECPSGVCEEAAGTCAADADIIYLSMSSGSDAGDCTSSAPCATFGYALGKAAGTRNVVRIQGGFFDVGSNTVAITGKSLVIDGDATNVTRSGSTTAPTFSVGGGAVVTFEGLRFVTSSTSQALSVPAGGDATMYGINIVSNTGVATAGPLDVNGGQLTVNNSTFTYAGGSTGQGTSDVITCSGAGQLLVERSQLQNSDVVAQGCTLTVKRNVFDEHGDGSINAMQGLIVIENNLIKDSYELADSMHVTKATSPGSTVRFNTFVNTSGVTGSGATYLFCDSSVSVTSNIFAWRSGNLLQTCDSTDSVFDSSVQTQPPGTGNQIADISTIFADLAHGDFHLAAASPAKGAGEPGLVMEDLDGNPRPQPAGSNPDVGAYEAP